MALKAKVTKAKIGIASNEDRKQHQNQTQAEQSQGQDRGLLSSNLSNIPDFAGGTRASKIDASSNQ